MFLDFMFAETPLVKPNENLLSFLCKVLEEMVL